MNIQDGADRNVFAFLSWTLVKVKYVQLNLAMIPLRFNYTAARHSETSFKVERTYLAREAVPGETILSAKHFLKK